MMFSAEIQYAEFACGHGRNLRRKESEDALHFGRELVYRYVQSQYQAFTRPRRRIYGMGGWKLRKRRNDALSVYDSPGTEIIL